MAPPPKTCPICSKEFVPRFKKVISCSRKCGRQMAERNIDKVAMGAAISAGKKGKTHRGAPHSDETKRLLSAVTKERMSDPLRNPFIGKSRSLESREKQSRTRSQNFVDGKYQWKTWCEGRHVDTVKAGRVWVRSSWEFQAALKLDSDPSVVTFAVEPCKIPYQRWEGERFHTRHYVPDFLATFVDGKRKLIEVKPKCHLKAAINEAKFAAARERCAQEGWEFEVWSSKEVGLG